MKSTAVDPSAAPNLQVGRGQNDAFGRLVRDALRHLHDPIYLRSHPLLNFLSEPPSGPSTGGKRLQALLMEAMSALRPAGERNDARASRRHDLLGLRYIEALEIGEVADRLGISRREYTRQHREALDAVILFLEERGAFASGAPASAIDSARLYRPFHGLPLPLSSFIGRERETREIGRLIESFRLVTLTGPPGTGKTRLALHMAAELAVSPGSKETFGDTITFVPLASIAGPELVLSSLAQALGVREALGRDSVDCLVDALGHRKALLILDNFEHVLPAAPLVARMLQRCPGIRVLVTSREALRLSGEHEFAVPPLDVPEDGEIVDLERVAQCPSVRLYVERSAAMRSRFRLTEENAPAVIELCRRLDGLPLAIELAAARSRIFPPYALLGRLAQRGSGNSALDLLGGGARDLPPRQQTLRNAIDWSYNLLSPADRRIFARLAVFGGGWTLEAAEAVCSLHGERDVLEGMASLVDKSLVQVVEMPGGEQRFTMLETIREYAREQCEASEEAETIRRRHAEYFLAYAQQGEDHYWGPHQTMWLRLRNRELDNLRAALSWAIQMNDVELALQLGGALRMFWFDSGLRKEGQNWLERALRLSPSNPLTVDRAVALNAVGECCWLLGEYEAADSYFQQALEISRELRDMRGMGQALVGLSVIAVQRGDRAEALRCCEEALPLSRAAGDLPFVALALHGFGIQAVIDNDESLAQVRIEESLRIWRELGDIEHESLACNNLGDLARKSGRYEEAAALYRECLRLIGEDGPQGWRATYLHNLAHALHRLGNVDEARHLFVQALGYARDLGDRRGVAECVAGLAGLVVEREPERTVRLFAAAEAIAEAMGSHLNPANRMEYDHILMLARRYVGEESFPVAWEQGRALALEEAIAEALAANGTSSQA